MPTLLENKRGNINKHEDKISPNVFLHAGRTNLKIYAKTDNLKTLLCL